MDLKNLALFTVNVPLYDLRRNRIDPKFLIAHLEASSVDGITKKGRLITSSRQTHILGHSYIYEWIIHEKDIDNLIIVYRMFREEYSWIDIADIYIENLSKQEFCNTVPYYTVTKLSHIGF